MSYLLPNTVFLETWRAVAKLKNEAAEEIQKLAIKMIEPIKDVLPPSLKICEENTAPDEARAGVVAEIEFLPIEGRLILVKRCYFPPKEPKEVERRNLLLKDWITYGSRVILKIKEVAEEMEAGDSIRMRFIQPSI